MDSQVEVVISSFVNIHLFWIIPKKDLLLRTVMHKVMDSKPDKLKNICKKSYKKIIVCINLDGIWARANIIDIIETSDDTVDTKYLCWLLDFGVVSCVHQIFNLPKTLEKCPPLVKQASLYQVVNLTTDLVLGESGYEIKLKKTINDIQGVKQVALDYLEAAEKLYFCIVAEDDGTLYGDIVCLLQEGYKMSLTQTLISENLIVEDNEMFRLVRDIRDKVKDMFVRHSPNWKKTVDKKIENKNLDNIIFKTSKQTAVGFFDRFTFQN